jgi:hypothetical protein
MEENGQLHTQAALSPGKHGTHWIPSWVGLRPGLETVEQRTISCLSQESNPGNPARSPSLYRLRYKHKTGIVYLVGISHRCIGTERELRCYLAICFRLSHVLFHTLFPSSQYERRLYSDVREGFVIFSWVISLLHLKTLSCSWFSTNRILYT